MSEDRFDAQPTASNHFAWLRTEMALQRTLMAAVRTSVSLTGFGFTVAQFFQRIQNQPSDTLRHLGPDAPRNLGMVLIAAGVLSLLGFTFQYQSASKYLREGPFKALTLSEKVPMHNSSVFSAVVVMLIGVAAFLSVFARF